MIVKEARNKIVEIARSYIGIDENDPKFKKIVDQYNSCKPLPRNVKMLYTWDWCACFASSVFIEANMQDAIYREISTNSMIEGFKKIGRWVEDDSYIPQPADIIMYSWKDNGKGDCSLPANHTGIVEKVENGIITVIEGNKGEKCLRREIKVNGKYIRGYCLPNFECLLGVYKQKELKTSFYLYHDIVDIPSWALSSVKKAILKGIVKTNDGEHFNIWETNLQTIVWMDDLGLLD